MIKLFIDDVRYPPNDGECWYIVRNSTNAAEFVKAVGVPDFISFDHDLGDEDTAMVFLKWLSEYLFFTEKKFPAGFKFYVHSQNVVGATNIIGYMNNLVNQYS